MINDVVNIRETEFGVVLSILDSNLADELDDFLSEFVYIPYNQKFDGNKTTFYFGQVSCIDKVKKVC